MIGKQNWLSGICYSDITNSGDFYSGSTTGLAGDCIKV